MSRVRCAIYTRKSSDEGLDQAFNSLDAQREACEAYIASQRHEGWTTLKARYDDGGLSGGTLQRPALQALLEDIDAGRVDMVVVYKIDRLTRSLADFAKLVDRLDGAGASFVSVTQQFNTSTSMGRLTLNVLLSFAQFEREVTAERIRDKIAASKKKGLWMGGPAPLGYDATDKGLVVNEAEADTVRALFDAYLKLGCVRRLKAFADGRDFRTKTRTTKAGRTINGVPFSRGRLYHLLSNPHYVGRIPHKSESYDGQRQAIITAELWDRVQAKLAANRVARASQSNAAHPSPLAGKLFDDQGEPLTPSHAVKAGRRYRYYVSKTLAANSGETRTGWRLPAAEVEALVLGAVTADRDVRLAGSGQTPTRETAFKMVRRVEIHGDALRLVIDLASRGGAQTDHVVLAPFTLRRRGVEAKLTLAGDQARDPDRVLIRRILRATEWVRRLKSGSTMAEIAEGEGVSADFIAHTIDVAFLSPKILEAAAHGTLPAHLSAKAFTRMSMPIDWRDQEAALLG